MAFSSKQLECVKCKVAFANREALVVHLENFCIDSDWGEPSKKIQEIEREIKAQTRKDNWANETIQWDEVQAYLRLAYAGKYDEYLRGIKEDLVVGRMTLHDLRVHFRKNHSQFVYLTEYLEEKQQLGLVAALEDLKRTRKAKRAMLEKPTKQKKRNKFFVSAEELY